MTTKALDSRIRALLSNGVQEKKRSFVLVVGDHSKDVIVHLHYIMSSLDIKNQNRSILWAYKKDLLGYTSHRKKRELKIKKEIKRGIREANTEDPFELFISLNNIRHCYYKDTEKILGNTYGMCILQDFEAITPNLLAKTIETVAGGGLVVLLLRGMNSLKQLFTMSMDVHSRYRTEAHNDVTARFNERFILSLGKCESCLVIDDEMNVLPISGGSKVVALDPPDVDEPKTKLQIELEEIKLSVTEEDDKIVGPLVNLAMTVDQAKALQKFVTFISKKVLSSTLTLQAARGRGKSAALGVAIAAAVAHGYSNIFITSPSPENLKTLFEFIFKGFDALEYMDHVDYTILRSTNPDYNKVVVRVNIHRGSHRQTIQYIRPQDAHVLGQAELLVIDEAAAIPLPLVRKLIGPYLVFMASTINGYEGTGRSLSLKLIKELKVEAIKGGRSLEETELKEPIRYAQGDAVEKWLNNILCLDATISDSIQNTINGCPDLEQCELLSVNRDTLFSYREVPEKFLQQMVALYVSSHYKNSPDDLQLMSDAPAHQLFVLVGPESRDSEGRVRLPDPLCVIQVALEGQISRESVINSLSRGKRAAGDLIPWIVSQQFQEESFAALSGARIVRIASNPNYIGMRYGQRALQLLIEFYEGKFTNLSEDVNTFKEQRVTRLTDAELASSSLLDDNIKPRQELPPLFQKLAERRPENLDYVGVSYGLTGQLHKFWKNAEFAPVYLRQTANDLTGEYTCVMLRPLRNKEDAGLDAFSRDFHRRFLDLLGYNFRDFTMNLASVIIESANKGSRLDDPENQPKPLTSVELDSVLTRYDLKRLSSYANNMTDYHLIIDLIPRLALLYFTGRIKSAVKLSPVEQYLLLGMGLQRKDISSAAKEFPLPENQILSYLMKIMRKLTSHFDSLISGAVEANMPARETVGVSRADADNVFDDEIVDDHFEPLEKNLEEELEEGGDEAMKELKAKQRELINALPLEKYDINDSAPGWGDAEKKALAAVKSGKKNIVVSVKSTKELKRKPGESAAEIYEQEMGEKRRDKKFKKGKKDRS